MAGELGSAKGYLELDVTGVKKGAEDAARVLEQIDRAGKGTQQELEQLGAAGKGMGGAFQQAAEKSRLLSQQIDQAKQKGNVYRQEITNLNTVIERSQEKQKSLGEEIKKANDRYEKSEQKIKEVAEAHGKESEEYQKALEQSEKYRNELLNLETQYDELGQEIEDSQADVGRFEDELRKTDASVKQMSQDLAVSESRFATLGTSLQKTGQKLKTVGSGMSSVGGKLSMAVTAPLAAAGTASIKMATDAETSYSKVKTIADSTVLSYDKLKTGVTSASNETGVAITDFNEALYSSMSAGVETGKAIGFTTDMVKLAKGGFTDTSKAVDVVTTVLNAYGKSADEASSVSDKLITTQNLGKTTVDELSSSMGKVIPTAKAVNVGIDDVSTAFAVLTKNGIATAEASTYYNSMLNELGKSGTKADKALRDMSGKGFAQLVAEGKPVTEILGMLQKKADESGMSLSDMFGSAEASKAALTIMKGNGKEYNQILKQMKGSAGATQKAFEEMDSTPAAKMQKELNKLKNAGIKVGGQLLPYVTKGVKAVGNLAEKFSKLSPAQQGAIVKTAGFAMALGPVLKVTGSVTSGVGSMTKGIGKLMEAAGKKSALQSMEKGVGAVGDAAVSSTKGVGGFAGIASKIGVKGGIAGAAAIAVIGMGLAFKKAKEDAEKANLEEHFGSVKLSAEEVEDVAKRLTTNKWTVRLDAAVEAKEKLEDFRQQIQTAVNDMNKQEWKVRAGLELTAEEKESYRQSVSSYVKDVTSYIEQQQYTASLAIDAVMTPGSTTHKNFKDSSNKFYKELNGELTKLGKELSDLVNKAWSDGVLSDTEIDKIDKKKAQIQKKLDEIAQAKYDLKMGNIKADASKGGLSAESFSDLQKQMSKEIEKRKKQLEERKMEMLLEYQVQLNAGDMSQEEFDQKKQKIENDIDAKMGDLTVNSVVDVSLDTIKSNYGIKEASEKMSKDMNKYFKDAFQNTPVGADIDWTSQWTKLADNFETSFANVLDPTSQGLVGDFLKNMRPQTKELEDLAKHYKEAGQLVPSKVREGLSDVYEMEAMAGDTSHMYELLGMQMGNSPEFLDAVAKAQESGAELPRGLVEGIETATGQVYDAATHTWNQVGEAATATKDEVKDSVRAAGIEITGGIKEALNGKSEEVYGSMVLLLNQMANGVELKRPELKTLMNNLGIDTTNNLLTSMESMEPQTQAQAMELLSQLQTAEAAKRPEILAQLFKLGVAVDNSLGKGLYGNVEFVKEGSKVVINSLNGSAKKRIGEVTPEFVAKLKGMGISGVKGMEKVVSNSNLTVPPPDTSDWGDAAIAGLAVMEGVLSRNPLSVAINAQAGRVGALAQHANGGFVNSEQLSWLAEGNQPEVVIPLSSAKRSRAMALYEQTGAALGVSAADTALRNRIMDEVGQSSQILLERENMTIEVNTPAVNIDIVQLAKVLADELRKAPVKADVTVEMQDGDVYIDQEKAGRKLAPVISRIQAKNN